MKHTVIENPSSSPSSLLSPPLPSPSVMGDGPCAPEKATEKSSHGDPYTTLNNHNKENHEIHNSLTTFYVPSTVMGPWYVRFLTVRKPQEVGVSKPSALIRNQGSEIQLAQRHSPRKGWAGLETQALVGWGKPLLTTCAMGGERMQNHCCLDSNTPMTRELPTSS